MGGGIGAIVVYFLTWASVHRDRRSPSGTLGNCGEWSYLAIWAAKMHCRWPSALWTAYHIIGRLTIPDLPIPRTVYSLCIRNLLFPRVLLVSSFFPIFFYIISWRLSPPSFRIIFYLSPFECYDSIHRLPQSHGIFWSSTFPFKLSREWLEWPVDLKGRWGGNIISWTQGVSIGKPASNYLTFYPVLHPISVPVSEIKIKKPFFR